VHPKEHFINWQQDPYSNHLARLVFPRKTDSLSVEVDLIAELTVVNPFDFFLDKYAEIYPFEYDPTLLRELAPYLERLPAGPLLSSLIQNLRREHLRTVDYIVELNQVIQRQIRYLIRMEPGIQTLEQTLTLMSGSCRDSSWLLVQLLRHLGLAARFVSGYLVQLAPDVKPLDGPASADRDVLDLHAWAEVYLPGAGWVGLDPTSGLLTGEGHLPLACSAEPSTAAAISGMFSTDDESVVETEPDPGDTAQEELRDKIEFVMAVARIHEDPRVTKPYNDEQWMAIEALGHRVDADLKAMDVRLTMGGEPTFVSIDDMDGAEWNTTALGPEKYRHGNLLGRRLRDRFAPNGLLHFGQGKWYPGESLPRWALGLYWRKDGEAIWRDPRLMADEQAPAALGSNSAQEFIAALAERLDVNPQHALSAYEDAWYYAWKERRLPVNVSVFENQLKNEQDRARLARVFERGLDEVVGYVLPLRREYSFDGNREWASGAWSFRSEQMFLLPGDSPIGYRLPLDSIPWVSKSEYPYLYEQDPLADRAALPNRTEMLSQRYLAARVGAGRSSGFVEQVLGPELVVGRRRTEEVDVPLSVGVSAPWIIRTALCTEVRDGVLRVFMPPQRYLEDYLDLITAIEDTAADLEQPVLVEGYAPPSDSRLNAIKVTPDPGVIEVNLQPAGSWDELTRNITALYEEARLSRLGTEKFMLDGRHSGTGGGNHIVVGGPSPVAASAIFPAA
jgi:transglutaminase-like putative cysteine protease